MADPRLADLVGRVRRFLEPRWSEWHLHEGSPALRTPSQGTCGRSSLFLCQVLQQHGIVAGFAAGDPTEGQKGFHTAQGWKGHAWVEAENKILDVTADQFGLPPVVITGTDDPRYGRGTDTSEPEFIARRQRMVRELMTDWMAQNEEKAI
ncbi:hypothetical protein TG4357_01828 [Thalassovita gelatinovora]|uniref:Transglutaminase-like superfamily protein n=1 Tax=Thalassovita gelatinovora TaxID=53501 RepID=A0A0P1FZR1_THAGE|nr:hypothetical protein [Thalassovita gelatinovora]QIZ80744.1 hypothetical protein HFZ77_09755 [Thalassovita gelatinovora]CUH65374.1 hypothetical protein TG4357_01828 [Thalassovita gelatinovora]SEQ90143.1 hypothetical protein SAMN04488043_110116 [Thalassovita gelatinovora]